MTTGDAFKGEMDFLRQLAADDDHELVAFAQALQSTLIREPDPGTAASLIPRLAAAARVSRESRPVVAQAKRAPVIFRRRTFALKIAMAAVLIPATFAGLAFAGTRLPAPARSAFESVGIELPNQTESDGETTKPNGVDDQGDGRNDVAPVDGDRHQRRGEAVSKRARGKAHREAAREQRRRQHNPHTSRPRGKSEFAPGSSKPKGNAKDHANPQSQRPTPGRRNGAAKDGVKSPPPGQVKPPPTKWKNSPSDGSGNKKTK